SQRGIEYLLFERRVDPEFGANALCEARAPGFIAGMHEGREEVLHSAMLGFQQRDRVDETALAHDTPLLSFRSVTHGLARVSEYPGFPPIRRNHAAVRNLMPHCIVDPLAPAEGARA